MPKEDPFNETWLTVSQTQKILNCSRKTVYRMLDDGRLEHIRVGNQYRVPGGRIRDMLTTRNNAANQDHENDS